MATQALSEEPHCFNAAGRWKEYLLDEGQGIPVYAVPQARCDEVLGSHGAVAQGLALVQKWKAKPGEVLMLPDDKGTSVRAVLLGVGKPDAPSAADCWSYAALPAKLPAGTYHIEPPANAGAGSDAAAAAQQAALGWALGTYSFDRYKSNVDKETGQSNPPRVQAKLVWPKGADKTSVTALATSFFWARDLITTPAEDLGPGHMVAEARALAAAHPGADIKVIRGDDLLEQNFPAIHTVGRACARPPALIDINWSPKEDAGSGSAAAALPLLALVGKGVCFDSGGLDIKSAAGMKSMKKDMGGAALVLALAHVVMSCNLPARLRLLVPAVENSIAGNAYRPLDVLRTRAGITVENGNTDAEGRLILCDALYEACTGGGATPDLIIDAATLTGAARVALGPDIPAIFTNCDEAWQQLNAAADEQAEPVWRLPLHAGYRKMLDSKVADISSTGGEGGQGGAITAALYLSEFVTKAPRWMHIDTPAWVSSGVAGPGRPEGGEPQALRALWAMLRTRYQSYTS